MELFILVPANLLHEEGFLEFYIPPQYTLIHFIFMTPILKNKIIDIEFSVLLTLEESRLKFYLWKVER